MKYIIDIPNSDVSRWIAETPLGKKLYIPISVEDRKEYSIATEIYAEEYTEPDRKAIEDEVWDLAKKVECMGIGEIEEAFDIHRENAMYPFNQMSYKEAKRKYEAWKKSKEEICVGDELKDDGNIRAVVLDILDVDYMCYEVFTENGIVDEWQKGIVFKTGRHFDDIADLLKKMKEGDSDD